MIDDVITLLRFYKGIGVESLEKSRAVKEMLSFIKPSGNKVSAGPLKRNVGAAGASARFNSSGRLKPSGARVKSAPITPLKAENPLARVMEKACGDCELKKITVEPISGIGPETASLMVVDEIPCADDAAKGQPFQGKAGEMLSRMLRAIRIERGQVRLTAALKCRPASGKLPEGEDLDCAEIFLKEIERVKPKFILSMGLLPARMVLKAFSSIPPGDATPDMALSDLRGRVLTINNDIKTRLVVTHSPASILRQSPAVIKRLKQEAWHDLQILEKLYHT